MQNAAKFWNRIAEGYAKKPVPDENIYQTKLAKTRELFTPEMQVVEFGCGTGTTALSHAPHVKHIHASDFSAAMVAIAQGKQQQQGIDNVSFSCKGMNELTFDAGSIDAVMGHSILHLLENKEEVVAKVYDWLKPGGYFVSSTVCIADFFLPMKWLAPIGCKLGFLPLVKVFSRQQLMAALKQAGFDITYEWQPKKTSGVFVIARKPQ